MASNMLNHLSPNEPGFYDNEYYLSLEYRYFSFAHRSRILTLISALGDIANKKVLDIGGGAGYLAQQMQSKGAQVVVTDFSKSAIEWGKERFPSLDFKLLSIAELSSLNDRYDLITAFDVIEHLSKPEELLNTAKNLLKPDGKLFVSTDNVDSPFYTNKVFKKLDNALMRYGVEGQDYSMIKRVENYRRKIIGKDYHRSHVQEFSLQSLQQIISDCGYDIEFFKTYHLWSNWIKSLITLFLGRKAGTGMVFCCRVKNTL